MNNYLTIRQAASVTGRSDKTIRRWIEKVKALPPNEREGELDNYFRKILNASGNGVTYELNPEKLFVSYPRARQMSSTNDQVTSQNTGQSTGQEENFGEAKGGQESEEESEAKFLRKLVTKQSEEISAVLATNKEVIANQAQAAENHKLALEAAEERADKRMNQQDAMHKKILLLVQQGGLALNDGSDTDEPKEGNVAKAEAPNPVKKVEVVVPDPIPDPAPDPAPAPNPAVEETRGVNSTLASNDNQITNEEEMDIEQPDEVSNPQQV